MKLIYYITDPNGKLHEATAVSEYEQTIFKLRQQFGADCELLVRAELQDQTQLKRNRVA
jgi:hypothetical protein